MTARHSLACMILVLAAIAPPARAHEGHEAAPGAPAAAVGATSRVLVSSQARENLGLQIAEAEIRPMEATLGVIGEIAALPDRSGAVTSRIAGRVSWIGVAEGDVVRKGEPLVEVESLQLGDPPPRARYGAPLAGRVIDRHVTLGSSVEVNAHLLEVADLRDVLAVGQLFEGQIARVRVGQKVRVRATSYPDTTFNGVVERVGSALDSATRSLPLYVRIRNPDSNLLPRMRAELSVVVASSEAALAIPRSALLGEFGNEFVFVEKDPTEGVFERVPVVRGLADDQFVEVIEGVLPGDRVVTVGNYSLQFLPPYQGAPHGSDGSSADPGGVTPKASPPASFAWYVLAFAGGVLAAVITGGVAWARRRGRI